MNKKLTKLLSVFLIAGALGTGVAGATGCTHKHSYDKNSWVVSEDTTKHGNPSTCKHKGLTANDEPHEDADKNGYCDKCGVDVGEKKPDDSKPDDDKKDPSGDDDKKDPSGDDDKKDPSGEEQTVTVSSVSVSTEGNKLTIKARETLQLTATVTATPDEAANKEVTWTSSDEAIATVSETGLVTAVKDGSVTITATSKKDNTKTAGVNLTVNSFVTVYDNDYRMASVEEGEENFPTEKGVYKFIKTTKGDASDGKACDFAVSGDTLALTDASDTDTAYGYIRFDDIENKKVKIDFSVSVSVVASKWTVARIVDKDGNNVLALVAGSDSKIGLAVSDGNQGTIDSAITYVKDTAIDVSLTFDLAEGTVSGTVIQGDKKAVYTDLEISAASVVGLKLQTASGTRNTIINSLVVKSADVNLADVQISLGAKLDAAKATYDETHKINGELVTAAYTEGKAAITAEDATIASVSAAYKTAIKNMADVISDADIALEMDLEADVLPNSEFQKAYNDIVKAISDRGISLIDVYVNGQFIDGNISGTEELYTEIEKLLYDAETEDLTGKVRTKAALAEWEADVLAKIGEIAPDSEILPTIIEEAIKELQAYRKDEVDALGEDASKKEQYDNIQAIIRDGDAAADPEVAEGTGVAAIKALKADFETADVELEDGSIVTGIALLETLKEQIDDQIDAANKTLAELQASLVGAQGDADDLGELQEVLDEIIVSDHWQSLIDDEVTKGKAAVWAVTEATENAKTAAQNAYDDMVERINFIAIDMVEAYEEIEGYGQEKIGDLNDDENDTLAAAAITAIEAIYDLDAEEISSYIDDIGKATDSTALNKAIDDAKAAINEIIKNLYEEELQVTVHGIDGITTATVKYGTALKASDIDVSGLEGKMVKAWHADSADGEIYDFTLTIYIGNEVELYAELVDATLVEHTTVIGIRKATSSGDTTLADYVGTGIEDKLNQEDGDPKVAGFVLVNKGKGLDLEFGGAGTYSIKFRGTGNSNVVTFYVVDAKGNKCEMTTPAVSGDTTLTVNAETKIYTLKSKTHYEVTFTVPKAGVYTFQVDSGSASTARVSQIKKVENVYEVNDVTVTWGNTTKTYHHDTEITAPDPTAEELNGKAFDGWYLNGVKWVDGTKLPAGNYEYTLQTRDVVPVSAVNITSANTVGLGKDLALTAELVGDGDDSLLAWSVVSGNASVTGNVLTLTEDAAAGDKITVKVVYDGSETIVNTMEITVVSTAFSNSLTFNNGSTSTTGAASYFTTATTTAGGNKGIVDGTECSKGLKVDGNANISFTCEGEVTLTIYFDKAKADSNATQMDIKIDGAAKSGFDAVENVEGEWSNVYKFEITLAKGTHTITKGAKEQAIYKVVVSGE